MDIPSGAFRSHERLDSLSKKWWLYLILLLLFFIPPYVARNYDPRQTMDLIAQVLAAPFIFAFPWLMPVAKIVPLVLIITALVSGNKIRLFFSAYVALLYLAIALFQNAAETKTYGLVILLGNLALALVVALLWIWEMAARRNDFTPFKRPIWRWWVAPVALLAFLSPITAGPMTPDPKPLHWLTNEAGLTFCMMTPVILAVLTLLYPRINLALLRVMSFIGMLFGGVNLLTWFILEPWGWWMGVLHIPLAAISVYAFVLSFTHNAEIPNRPSLMTTIG